MLGCGAAGPCAADLVTLRGEVEGIIVQILCRGMSPEQREGLLTFTETQTKPFSFTLLYSSGLQGLDIMEHEGNLLSVMLLEISPWE